MFVCSEISIINVIVKYMQHVGIIRAFCLSFFGGEDLLSDSSGWCITGAVYTTQNNETCIPQIPKKFRGVS